VFVRPVNDPPIGANATVASLAGASTAIELPGRDVDVGDAVAGAYVVSLPASGMGELYPVYEVHHRYMQ